LRRRLKEARLTSRSGGQLREGGACESRLRCRTVSAKVPALGGPVSRNRCEEAGKPGSSRIVPRGSIEAPGRPIGFHGGASVGATETICSVLQHGAADFLVGSGCDGVLVQQSCVDTSSVP